MLPSPSMAICGRPGLPAPVPIASGSPCPTASATRCNPAFAASGGFGGACGRFGAAEETGREMNRAIAAGDAPGFRRAAHSLKSNGVTFGATAFAETARMLEHTPLETLGDTAMARNEPVKAIPAYERAAIIARDSKKWKEVIERAGVKLE